MVYCFSLRGKTPGRQTPFRADKFISPGQLEAGAFSIKEHHNFFVISADKYRFTVFCKSGHVNCSGNKDFEECRKSLEWFNDTFSCCVSPQTDCRPVNSTWSGRFPHTALDIPRMKADCARQAEWRASLRTCIFPGAVFRRAAFPTVIVFANASFVIVGAKDVAAASRAKEDLEKNVLRCWCCRREVVRPS